MKIRLVAAILALTMLAGCSKPADDSGQVSISVDVLFTGGLVYDGSGNEPFLADLGVDGGKIAFIGDAASSGVQANETFDVTGHWVTPGFIDAHSHAMLGEDYGYRA